MNLDKIKLAFFDIDGTLVNAAGIVSPPVINALKKLKNKGVVLSIASGRPIFSAQWIIDLLVINGLSMLGSGSLIYDPLSKSVIHAWSLDKDKAMPMLLEGIEQGLHIELYSAHEYYVKEYNENSKIHSFYLKQDPLEADLINILNSKNINRMLFMATNEEDKKKVSLIRERHADFSWGIGRGATHPDILFANATHPLSKRDWAFDFITGRLGFSSDEVMAFGDAEADKIFIQKAGIGVAMEDAPEDVKAVSDVVCGSVEDDGIAKFLDQHMYW